MTYNELCHLESNSILKLTCANAGYCLVYFYKPLTRTTFAGRYVSGNGEGPILSFPTSRILDVVEVVSKRKNPKINSDENRLQESDSPGFKSGKLGRNSISSKRCQITIAVGHLSNSTRKASERSKAYIVEDTISSSN